MGLLNIYCKSDSCEHPYINTTIMDMEMHLCHTFLICVLGLLECLVSAKVSEATLRAEVGTPISEGISVFLTLVAIH